MSCMTRQERIADLKRRIAISQADILRCEQVRPTLTDQRDRYGCTLGEVDAIVNIQILTEELAQIEAQTEQAA